MTKKETNKFLWKIKFKKNKNGNQKNCFLLKILSRKPTFLKKIWPIDMMSLYSVVVVTNNSFMSEAFIVIGNVYLALFTLRSL